jgi:Fic family protein
MISYDDIVLSDDLKEHLDIFVNQVIEFRNEGPLDDIALAKLEEHFKAAHIFHSAGIEGNRLTLQETVLVLKEGIDISGKPLKDTVEVKNLGAAFDYLKTLSSSTQTLREADVRSIHSLLIGDDPRLSPGEYRKIGVIISGAEHKPPEPIEVPAQMEILIRWINANLDKNPIIVSTIAHHELVAIHPFVDGNGRVSRLVMNLILMKQGFPICNIRRGEPDRPAYYEALSFADVGLYDPLVQLVMGRCSDLFNEYVRIRTETKRMAEWAKKWGSQASTVLLRRESREMELWLSRLRQVFIEFQKAAELLDDQLKNILGLSFYDYKNEITFEKYQQLVERGSISQANAFSVTFYDERKQRQEERFMFRYRRNWDKFVKPERSQDKIIPLELTYFDKATSTYLPLSELEWTDRIRIRDLYFLPDTGEFVVRYFRISDCKEVEKKGMTIYEAAQWFYDDILRNVFGLTDI